MKSAFVVILAATALVFTWAEDDGQYRPEKYGADDGRYHPSDEGKYYNAKLEQGNSGAYYSQFDGFYKSKNAFTNNLYNTRSGKYDDAVYQNEGFYHKYNPSPSTFKYDNYHPKNDQSYYASEPFVAITYKPYVAAASSIIPKHAAPAKVLSLPFAAASSIGFPGSKQSSIGLTGSKQSKSTSNFNFAPASGIGFPKPITAHKPQFLSPRYDIGNFKGRTANVLRQDSDASADSYHYLYKTENGIDVEEAGKVQPGSGTRAGGHYEFVADDGVQYRVEYTADEHGFRARGAHLPTPPPIPAAIARSLAFRGIQV